MNQDKLKLLVQAAKAVALEQTTLLTELKSNASDLDRPDFLWHYLLQSFATMGKSDGWHGLIGDEKNYEQVRFETLELLPKEKRKKQVHRVCHDAGIRWPDLKAEYILNCFEQVQELGGPEAAKARLLEQTGREGKIRFLKETFRGIGPKYARNIMMDVYHPDFRDSIALDARIKSLSNTMGLTFRNYEEHENFYLEAAALVGLSGWELDRLIFNFLPRFKSLVAG